MKEKSTIQATKGITLVSLVITIIILLILAGVAINVLFGADGLIGKAKSAAESWNSAIGLEEIQLNLHLARLNGVANNSDEYQQKLDELLNEGIVVKGLKKIEYNGEYEIAHFIVEYNGNLYSMQTGKDKEETIASLKPVAKEELKNIDIIFYQLIISGELGDLLNNESEIIEQSDTIVKIGFPYNGKEYIFIVSIDERNNGEMRLTTSIFTHLGYKSITTNNVTGVTAKEAIVEYEGKKYSVTLDSSKEEEELLPIMVEVSDSQLKQEHKLLLNLNKIYGKYIETSTRTETIGNTTTTYFNYNWKEYKYILIEDEDVVIQKIEATGVVLAKPTFTQIETGSDFAVGLDTDGKVWTWGSCAYGQLGNGIEDENLYIAIEDMKCISDEEILKGTKITQVFCLRYSTFLIDDNGSMWSWGQNNYGQLGIGNTINQSTPNKITTLEGVKIEKVQSNENDSIYAIDSNGKLWTWGANRSGQLGNGTNTSSNVPICISNNEPLQGVVITKVQMGEYDNVIAIDSTGRVWTWGYNGSGQLGDGTNTKSNVPICISNNEPLQGVVITKVQMRYDNVIALDSTGRVWTWGDNYSGQLGNGTNTSSNVPICISNNEPLQGVVITKVQMGYDNVIALDSTGRVWTWGDNGSGQLGDGTRTDSNVPICISNSGSLQNCIATKILENGNILDSNGRVWNWGDNILPHIISKEAEIEDYILSEQNGYQPYEIVLYKDANGKLWSEGNQWATEILPQTEEFVCISDWLELQGKQIISINQYTSAHPATCDYVATCILLDVTGEIYYYTYTYYLG